MMTLFGDDVRAAYLSGDLEAVQALCAPLSLISEILDSEDAEDSEITISAVVG